jgi:hypothetical protein
MMSEYYSVPYGVTGTYADKSNSYTAPAEATRESDVSGQVSMQDKLTQEALEYALKLSDKLAPVLRETGPAVGNETPREKIVPLAEELRKHNDRLMQVITTINGIIQRLEL